MLAFVFFLHIRVFIYLFIPMNFIIKSLIVHSLFPEIQATSDLLCIHLLLNYGWHWREDGGVLTGRRDFIDKTCIPKPYRRQHKNIPTNAKK